MELERRDRRLGRLSRPTRRTRPSARSSPRRSRPRGNASSRRSVEAGASSARIKELFDLPDADVATSILANLEAIVPFLGSAGRDGAAARSPRGAARRALDAREARPDRQEPSRAPDPRGDRAGLARGAGPGRALARGCRPRWGRPRPLSPPRSCSRACGRRTRARSPSSGRRPPCTCSSRASSTTARPRRRSGSRRAATFRSRRSSRGCSRAREPSTRSRSAAGSTSSTSSRGACAPRRAAPASSCSGSSPRSPSARGRRSRCSRGPRSTSGCGRPSCAPPRRREASSSSNRARSRSRPPLFRCSPPVSPRSTCRGSSACSTPRWRRPRRYGAIPLGAQLLDRHRDGVLARRPRRARTRPCSRRGGPRPWRLPALLSLRQFERRRLPITVLEPFLRSDETRSAAIDLLLDRDDSADLLMTALEQRLLRHEARLRDRRSSRRWRRGRSSGSSRSGSWSCSDSSMRTRHARSRRRSGGARRRTRPRSRRCSPTPGRSGCATPSSASSARRGSPKCRGIPRIPARTGCARSSSRSRATREAGADRARGG